MPGRPWATHGRGRLGNTIDAPCIPASTPRCVHGKARRQRREDSPGIWTIRAEPPGVPTPAGVLNARPLIGWIAIGSDASAPGCRGTRGGEIPALPSPAPDTLTAGAPCLRRDRGARRRYRAAPSRPAPNTGKRHRHAPAGPALPFLYSLVYLCLTPTSAHHATPAPSVITASLSRFGTAPALLTGNCCCCCCLRCAALAVVTHSARCPGLALLPKGKEDREQSIAPIPWGF